MLVVFAPHQCSDRGCHAYAAKMIVADTGVVVIHHHFALHSEKASIINLLSDR